jgi:hypothetical protein
LILGVNENFADKMINAQVPLGEILDSAIVLRLVESSKKRWIVSI